ncbi:MAG: VPLPA-CTERM sorting domain-containing protein [Parvularculaceae bacterium]|nr:VPLPA-CTERM sorting domain-containing protein [Parvularculaceae bacterium]
MKNLLAALAGVAVAAAFGASAHATTFIFKGGAPYDTPTGNIAFDCGTVGVDFCSADDAAGLSYSKDGITVTAVAYTAGGATQLIQDISPENSGLGALSENNNIDDQTQTNSGEWIVFTFNQSVTLSNIEFNAGNDTDCSTPGDEGPCGNFDLFINNVFFGNLTAVDLLAGPFIGSIFKFVPTTAGAGFAVAQFTVTPEVPVPAALPLLLSGLAGLGFAARRKRPA